MTKIEWTEKTWNPIVGCSVVSPGCTNCYAMKMAARLDAICVSGGHAYDQDHGCARKDAPLLHYRGLTKPSKAGPVWTGKLALAPDHILREPLRRKKPTIWFVNSMGDLFHEDVPDEWIDSVFAVMALCPQHTFQVLTKRSARMREYCDSGFGRLADVIISMRTDKSPVSPLPHVKLGARWWPLPNVWLGVSTEDQRRADERIPDLLATPAAVRFVSAEPLLGEIDFTRCFDRSNEHAIDALEGRRYYDPRDNEGEQLPGLDWIIVGGESGPGARPMHPDWARSIRDQCQAAGVAFFFKQWGAWVSGLLDGDECWVDEDCYGPAATWGGDGGKVAVRNMIGEGRHWFRLGKKAAGRLLDGREHNDMPATAQRSEAAE